MSMDPRWTTEPSEHCHDLSTGPSYVIEQENPASHTSEYSRAYSQLLEVTAHPTQDMSWRSEGLLPTIQSNGPEVNLDTSGSLLRSASLSLQSTFPGSECPTVQSSVASFPGCQFLGPPSPSLPFLSQTTSGSAPIRRSSPAAGDPYEACLTRDALPAYFNGPNEHPHAGPPLSPRHFPGVPVSSRQPGTSSETYSPPLSVIGFDEEPLFQGDPTSSFGKVLGAAHSPAVIQEHKQTTQGMPLEREQKAQEKRKRDKARKRDERSNNLVTYTDICELLEIRLTPKKTLANRILRAVEKLVEQRKLLRDLQRQLDEAETQSAALRKKLAQRPP